MAKEPNRFDANLRQAEAIVRELRGVPHGEYSADYHRTNSLMHLLEILEADTPQTWNDLWNCAFQRLQNMGSPPEGLTDLLIGIGADRVGPLPDPLS